MDKLNVVDSSTVCAILDISDRTLRTWVSDLGCPSIKDGKTRTYEWLKVLEWYVSYASAKCAGVVGDFAPDELGSDGGDGENLTQANLRKIKADADLKQLLLAQKRAQVVSVAEAKAILDRLFGNLKSQLLSTEPLLNTRLEGEPDSIAREAAIRDFMETLCRDLSTGKVVRDAIAETSSADAIGEDDDQVDGIQAASDEITDQELNEAVLAMIAASIALEEAKAHDS